MTSQQIHDALTLLPADLIAEADLARTRKPRIIPWKKYLAVAACLALVLWGSGCYLVRFGARGGSSKAPMEAAAKEPMLQESHLTTEKSTPAEAAPREPAPESTNGICDGVPLAPTEAEYSTGSRTHATAPAEESLSIDHSHHPAEPMEEESGSGGWCGNTSATVYLDGDTYGFSGSPAVILTDILYHLDYREEELCRCTPEFTADTEMGKGYQINLTEYFVRFEGKQAALTPEQAEKIAAILEELR